MARFNLRLSITVLMLFTCISIFANAQPQYYHKWMNETSENLLNMGDEYINVKHCPDSALVCFSIVTNRYNKDLSNDEKILCCQAYLSNWFVYFFHYYDYQQAYYNLLKGADIRDELEIDYPQVDLNLGCFYNSLYDQCGEKSLEDKAIYHLKKAFDVAYKNDDKHVCDIAFSNLLGLFTESDKIKNISDEWKKYRAMPSDKEDFLHQYNSVLYKILIAMSTKDYDEALLLSDYLIGNTSGINNITRYKYMAYMMKSIIYSKKGEFTESIRLAKKAEKIAIDREITDARLAVYNALGNFYEEKKDKENAIKYRNKYYMLKDTLLNYRQVTSVSEMSFLNEVEKMNTEIVEIKQKKEIQNIILAVTILGLLIIAVFSIILMQKNKQMNKQNKNLFLNYKKLIKMEEDARMQAREYMHELKKRDNEQQQGTDKEKYQSSSLQSCEKEELIEKILNIMENVEEICSSSFSSDRLSELVGSNNRYVSQVINEKFECNFNALLNRYRINEACRRLSNDDEYACYTTEAISESVGFKSRTTFINSFKKITGLTPSQYQKIARKDKEETDK